MLINQRQIEHVSRINRDPLNQAALLQMRKVKHPPSVGVLHVLSLMQWWVEKYGPTLGEAQYGVEERIALLVVNDPAQLMQFLQDPGNTGSGAEPRRFETGEAGGLRGLAAGERVDEFDAGHQRPFAVKLKGEKRRPRNSSHLL